jgi:hypothetical protein
MKGCIMKTLLSKWYAVKLRNSMTGAGDNPESALWRILSIKHEVKRIAYKEEIHGKFR